VLFRSLGVEGLLLPGFADVAPLQAGVDGKGERTRAHRLLVREDGGGVAGARDRAYVLEKAVCDAFLRLFADCSWGIVRIALLLRHLMIVT